MPLGPIQYLPQQPNPFDIAAKGLQLGETIRGIREKRAVAGGQLAQGQAGQTGFSNLPGLGGTVAGFF